MSLIQYAKLLNNHKSYAYLKDVLERLPTQNIGRLEQVPFQLVEGEDHVLRALTCWEPTEIQPKDSPNWHQEKSEHHVWGWNDTVY